MPICPKCGQLSTTEKFCSNCWSEMTTKSKSSKKKEDPVKTPFRNIAILGVFLVAFGYFMSFMARQIASETPNPAAAPTETPSTTQAPAPTETPSTPTTGETPPPPLTLDATDTPTPAVAAKPAAPYQPQ